MKNVNGRRSALRVGPNPHSPESVEFTVDRYGPIEPDTMNQIVEWLESKGDLYKWEVGEEFVEDLLGARRSWPILKTQMKGSAIFKITDNEHDAQNTLANIKSKP